MSLLVRHRSSEQQQQQQHTNAQELKGQFISLLISLLLAQQLLCMFPLRMFNNYHSHVPYCDMFQIFYTASDINLFKRSPGSHKLISILNYNRFVICVVHCSLVLVPSDQTLVLIDLNPLAHPSLPFFLLYDLCTLYYLD